MLFFASNGWNVREMVTREGFSPLSESRMSSPFVLLGLMLAPHKSTEAQKTLREYLQHHDVSWKTLRRTAERHRCTAMWYQRLRDDALLDLLPTSLRDELHRAWQENSERNANCRQTLGTILQTFQKASIEVALLKDTVAFCDSLHGDPGAPFVEQLNLLVRPNQSDSAWNLLRQQGYEELESAARRPRAAARRQQQPSLLRRPGSVVQVALHTRPAFGQAGRLLPERLYFEEGELTSFDGARVHIPRPHVRIFHQALEALLPQRQFARGHISLPHLAEFTLLARRYNGCFEWSRWMERALNNGLGNAFGAYLLLTEHLMGLPWPCVSKTFMAQRHFARILAAEKDAEIPQGILTRLLTRGYTWGTIPVWEWDRAGSQG